MATGEITKLTPIEGGLTLLGNPKQMLRQAQEVAEVLMDVVLKQKLYQDIGKSRHIEVPAWQFAAHFYGISAKIVEGATVPYVDELTGAAGFKSRAEAMLISTGQVISAGEALCLNNEDNWSMRPKYEYQNGNRVQTGQVHVPSFQLMSMAQTRAIGKALSNILRFVVVLAGFADTPAEEMTGDEQDQRRPEDKKPGKEPERKSAQNGNGQLISEGQRKRIFAIAHEVNCPMNTVGQIIQGFGFDIAANITRDKYDALVKAVQEWQAAPTQK
jgi:hypothetical protein